MTAAWFPSSEYIENARLTQFMRDCGCASVEELHARSVRDVPWFTERVLDFLQVHWSAPYREVLDLSRGIQWPRWCVDGRLNIVDTCLRHRGEQPAVVYEHESGETRSWNYAELRAETAAWAAHLRSLGFGAGDAIGLHLPMLPQTIAVLLAINAIGACAAPLFSGFGPDAIASRLTDLEAAALITTQGFTRRGKIVEAGTVAQKAAERCLKLRHLIFIEDLRGLKPALQAEACSTEDPALIIYTSGTTGKPKGIVHTHCGFPVKAAQDMALNIDVHAGERVCWITDLGWMMGPWLIYGALILGATVCLYDGAFDYPSRDRLWEFCARHNINVLGLSPSLVRALAAHGAGLPERHSLSSLRVLASSGEPWDPASWRWLFENVGDMRVPIINYSGGTEISGGILSNTVIQPIKPCGFAGPCPGIDADVIDEQGRSVRGSVGELAIKAPWIGEARGFWRDPDRYLETYWSRVPGVWVHGDWAEIDDDGHWYILGRSDDTVKIAGKRVGPAEVESILVDHPDVIEAAVIGVPDELKGSAMVAFCVVQGENGSLAEQLSDKVAAALGKPLRPDKVHLVRALPKTRNAKLMRRVLRAAYLGQDPGDLTALENPGSVNEILGVIQRRLRMPS
ncbi:MAG: AMP-binding protein [Bryobacterales bacterium]|nr:AMP-binding protein [Bryobacterales bacterium]MBV9396634.1 AMP-binding protein [Bryobacterales bacterium]